MSKYVVSRTLDDPGWENSTVLHGTQLVDALIAAGLVDEYRLFVFPVVVGRGARRFESADARLKLLETRPFVSGAVLLRYAAAQ